jgi:hypothetical protein
MDAKTMVWDEEKWSLICGGFLCGMIFIGTFMIFSIESQNEFTTMFESHFIRVQSDSHPEGATTLCSIHWTGKISYYSDGLVVDTNSFDLTLPCGSPIFKELNGVGM